MMTKGRFVQAYNAHVAVTGDEIVVAVDVFQAPPPSCWHQH